MRLRTLWSCAALAAALGTAGCGVLPAQRPIPVYVRGRPPCRVWDEDIFGRRYCRVPYVYDTRDRNR